MPKRGIIWRAASMKEHGMRHLVPGISAAILLATQAVRAADPYKPDAGPYAVTSLLADWKDAARPGGEVTVPIKLYYPMTLAGVKAPLPLIVFSHGLGGSREGYQIWAEHW